MQALGGGATAAGFQQALGQPAAAATQHHHLAALGALGTSGTAAGLTGAPLTGGGGGGAGGAAATAAAAGGLPMGQVNMLALQQILAAAAAGQQQQVHHQHQHPQQHQATAHQQAQHHQHQQTSLTNGTTAGKTTPDEFCTFSLRKLQFIPRSSTARQRQRRGGVLLPRRRGRGRRPHRGRRRGSRRPLWRSGLPSLAASGSSRTTE